MPIESPSKRIRPVEFAQLYRVNVSYERRFGIYRVTFLVGRKSEPQRLYTLSRKKVAQESTAWISKNVDQAWRSPRASTYREIV